MSALLERFLRYVQYDTQSDERSTSSPSTEGQLALLRDLADELRSIGLADVHLDGFGYLTATVQPSSPATARAPTIGLLAHVDTSPELSGKGVRPIVHRRYDGRDLVLPDDPTVVLRASELPALRRHIGHDLVTASGTTLLGGDDKAGVAEIVTAAERLVRDPAIPHGAVRLAFTPDEEIGRGMAHFDVAAFGAVCAYTVDGGGWGELEQESFSADAMTLTFIGFNTHPGYAKGRMVNAIKVAADFIARLPPACAPETTEGYEGFVHPYVVQAGVDRTSVRLLVRDFSAQGLAEKEAMLESLAREAAARFPGSRVEAAIEPSYRNMREVLDQHPEVVARARAAMEQAGLEVRMPPIRGGTDGSRLSFRGLPTPNLFAGEHEIHSRLEWVSVQEMEKAVEVLVALARLWAT